MDRFQQLTQARPAPPESKTWVFEGHGNHQLLFLHCWLPLILENLPAQPHGCCLCCTLARSAHRRFSVPRLQSARDTASSILAGSVLLGAAPAPLAAPGSSAAAAPAASPAAGGAAAGARPGGGQGLGLAKERRRSSLEEASSELGPFEMVEGSHGWEGAGGGWSRPRLPPLTLAELRTFYDAEGKSGVPPMLPCCPGFGCAPLFPSLQACTPWTLRDFQPALQAG